MTGLVSTFFSQTVVASLQRRYEDKLSRLRLTMCETWGFGEPLAPLLMVATGGQADLWLLSCWHPLRNFSLERFLLNGDFGSVDPRNQCDGFFIRLLVPSPNPSDDRFHTWRSSGDKGVCSSLENWSERWCRSESLNGDTSVRLKGIVIGGERKRR